MIYTQTWVTIMLYADVNLTEQQAQELVDIARKIAGANVQNLRLVDAIEPKITAKSAADYGLPPICNR